MKKLAICVSLAHSLLPQAQRIILLTATHEMWNEYPAECRNAAIAFMAKH